MALSLTSVATDLVSDLGYGGVTLGMLLDSFGVPIPSEVLIPLTVVASQSGRFQLWLVFLIAVAAQVVGGLVSYFVGWSGGVALVERYGRYVLITPKDLERTQRAFTRFGPWFVGLGRCLPVVRGFVGYPAGVARMGAVRFAAWTAAGAAAWTGVLIGLGEVWRSNVSVIDKAVNKASVVIVVLLVIAVALHARRAFRPSSSKQGRGKGGIDDTESPGSPARSGSEPPAAAAPRPPDEIPPPNGAAHDHPAPSKPLS